MATKLTFFSDSTQSSTILVTCSVNSICREQKKAKKCTPSTVTSSLPSHTELIAFVQVSGAFLQNPATESHALEGSPTKYKQPRSPGELVRSSSRGTSEQSETFESAQSPAIGWITRPPAQVSHAGTERLPCRLAPPIPFAQTHEFQHGGCAERESSKERMKSNMKELGDSRKE